MDFFKDSDKNPSKEKYFPDTNEFELINISKELPAAQEMNAKNFFGVLTEIEIRDLLKDSKLITEINSRGFTNTLVEIAPLSFYDNRIFIRTDKGETLVHMRLKVDDFYLKKVESNLKMVYIDWLLTQNIRWKNKEFKKKLFEGQEYPGLNVMKEIENFISLLSRKIGAHLIFNIPEYFHDAVLFHKNFKFLDPEKEGTFRAILHNFSKVNLRALSEFIHTEKIWIEEKKEIYNWKHGEMIYSLQEDLGEKIFDASYKRTVLEFGKLKMRILQS
ncbi:MAG: hypothetical protein SFU98_06915 [Leptospiraceae bacterium]|nr:hypothetical protein [Leptospiraceae bacterium]